MKRIVAITGGIGSGKSMVSRMLEAMGYEVYDCDSRAKLLMDSSEDIKRVIADQICRDAILADGSIDRVRLADEVFADCSLLDKLNQAVHTAVKEDIARWCEHRTVAFVETAILYQSGLDKMVTEVWTVIAPRELRIERVARRNGMSRERIESRIDAQDGFEVVDPHPVQKSIINDGVMALLPQVESLL